MNDGWVMGIVLLSVLFFLIGYAIGDLERRSDLRAKDAKIEELRQRVEDLTAKFANDLRSITNGF